MVISKRCNVHRHFFENSSLDKRNINRLRGRLNIVKQKHNGGRGVDVDVLRGLDGLGVCALGVPNKEGLT